MSQLQYHSLSGFAMSMLCLLNLPLSEIRRIKSKSISDLEEGLCMYDPSPFTLVLEFWVRSRGVLRY